MYVCSNQWNCNQVREPVCGRGGPVTADSVTGTGPGSACKEPPTPPPPAAPPPKLGCRVHVRSQATRNYVASSGILGVQVC